MSLRTAATYDFDLRQTLKTMGKTTTAKDQKPSGDGSRQSVLKNKVPGRKQTTTGQHSTLAMWSERCARTMSLFSDECFANYMCAGGMPLKRSCSAFYIEQECRRRFCD